MKPDHLLLVLEAWRQAELDQLQHESSQSAGSHYLRERLQTIAERCCRDFPGDLLEIGCLNGSTTIRLAAVARLHGRRVLAVDPWEPNTQNISADAREYDCFLQTTAPWQDYIDVVKLDSRSPAAIAAIQARPLALAFVDGLHDYHACLSDIRACFHSPVIAVDDITWSPELERAFVEGAGNRARVVVAGLHEGYIV